MAAYKFVRRLKALGCLTAYECTCEIWAPEPNRFILDPLHQMPRLITYAACWIVGALIDPAPATRITCASSARGSTVEAPWKQICAKLLETKRNPHPFDNTNPSAQPAPKPRKKRSFVSAHDQHAGRCALSREAAVADADRCHGACALTLDDQRAPRSRSVA